MSEADSSPQTHNETLTLPKEQIDVKGHAVFSKWSTDIGFLKTTWRGELFSLHNLHPNSCTNCSEYMRWGIDEAGNISSETSCSHSEGVTYSVTLKVPSGRVVFADSLFHVFKDLHDTKDLDYNSAVGRETYAKRLAAHNIAYGSVIECSPNVYLDKNTNSLILASIYDEEEEGEMVPESWVDLGYIITDLWAYSITDYDTFKAAGGQDDDSTVTFAEVPAGSYTFTHYADSKEWEHVKDEGEEEVIIVADSIYTP